MRNRHAERQANLEEISDFYGKIMRKYRAERDWDASIFSLARRRGAFALRPNTGERASAGLIASAILETAAPR
jgi:hypothetical protein